ncbi:MAG: hypothetical protein C0511_09205 [Hyphomicrobium sp.]|nr:hypothetical protein [Hyphomicrobium sp.]
MQLTDVLTADIAAIRKATGVILYEGPSKIDGAPIVVIATGINGKSRNPKTGAMVQTWIIRSDIHPVEALRTGGDVSICGDCRHRPQGPNGSRRSCYVNPMGPASIYRTYRAGKYPKVNAFQAAELFAGRVIRLGAYGDPMAAPYAMWQIATRKAEAWTGYTHQWRNAALRKAGDWAGLVMASADTLQDMDDAHALGFRTFRVTAAPFQNVKGREAVCPASDEKGKVAQCVDCRACMGTASKARVSIQIAAHGNGARNFA